MRRTQRPGGVLSGREALGTTAGEDAAHPEVLLRTDVQKAQTDTLPTALIYIIHTGQYKSAQEQAQTSLRPDEAQQDLTWQSNMECFSHKSSTGIILVISVFFCCIRGVDVDR